MYWVSGKDPRRRGRGLLSDHAAAELHVATKKGAV